VDGPSGRTRKHASSRVQPGKGEAAFPLPLPARLGSAVYSSAVGMEIDAQQGAERGVKNTIAGLHLCEPVLVHMRHSDLIRPASRSLPREEGSSWK